MSLLLKIMSNENIPDNDSRKTFNLYADIVSAHFNRHEDGSATAHLWVREPVKTAEVPGFVEVEKYVDVTGNCYLMNDNGKTIATFCPSKYVRV